MLEIILHFCANYLIEFMAGLLVFGLFFRWSTYRKSLGDNSYFNSFVGEVEKALGEKETVEGQDVTEYIEELLETIKGKLPSRSVRDHKAEKSKYSARNVVSLREFVSGEKGLFYSILSESSTLKSKYPPNYNDLTERILEQDDSWSKIFGFIPIAPIARLNDVLPAIFVVMGIFGTFIGISMALPEIANIDFSNLDKSGEILTRFVLSVTFAMKTSIAGIMFSLIMTMLNTLAPVRGIRDKTFKKLANCFENVWIALHGRKNGEQELLQVLPDLVEEIKQMRHNMSDKEAS